ncbi:Phage transcriptional regulator [Streptococcus equinus]|uniref:helix-turn-helix domain-containing protein n=1 Tax=Streptococcus equinus TaxID=1335 RepID=UPI000F6ECCED|nr:helix-turn-helix transcriptional regulator [Streptococcus equinus]VEE21581.1 Phage transcriptional regulator [Streptococcus equinus]
MNRLKELRKEKKLTQKELAEETDIPYRTLQRWENGETDIKSDKAELLADYFGVSIPYLLGYEVIDLIDTTYLEEYVFFDGDYSNPDKTKKQYFEEISEKIKIYKKVLNTLGGRYDKDKVVDVLELLEKNNEDDLDDIYCILQDKLELALFRYIAQYQLLMSDFYHLDNNIKKNQKNDH